MFNIKIFGECVRQIREAQQITARELAGQLGIDIANLSRLENGVSNKPRYETIANVRKIIANYDVVKDGVFNFSKIYDKYGEEASDTIDEILRFTEKTVPSNAYNSKLYGDKIQNVADNYQYLSSPIEVMLNNHIACSKYFPIVNNSANKFNNTFTSYNEKLREYENENHKKVDDKFNQLTVIGTKIKKVEIADDSIDNDTNAKITDSVMFECYINAFNMCEFFTNNKINSIELDEAFRSLCFHPSTESALNYTSTFLETLDIYLSGSKDQDQ